MWLNANKSDIFHYYLFILSLEKDGDFYHIHLIIVRNIYGRIPNVIFDDALTWLSPLFWNVSWVGFSLLLRTMHSVPNAISMIRDDLMDSEFVFFWHRQNVHDLLRAGFTLNRALFRKICGGPRAPNTIIGLLLPPTVPSITSLSDCLHTHTKLSFHWQSIKFDSVSTASVLKCKAAKAY